jgi:hypothetical protein
MTPRKVTNGVRAGHTFRSKASEQLHLQKRREKKRDSNAHRSSNYETTSIVKKISARRMQQHQERSPMVTRVGTLLGVVDDLMVTII